MKILAAPAVQILVAVDSSDASRIAACEVAARPWPAGTTVQVVSVVQPVYDGAPEVDQVLRQSAEQTVQCAAEHFKRAGFEVRTAVLTGDPKGVIVSEAAEWQADFIVLGSHHAGVGMQFLLGSVARAVAHMAACSVEIVRATSDSGPRRVLLAPDGSECSNAAVRSVAERPWPPGAAFRILSVVEPSAPLLRPPYFSPETMEKLRGKDMQRAQDAVSSAETILFEAGWETSSTVAVPAATPKELILNEARDWGAGLIVVGSHGRRGVNRFLLGSVSEAVALHADCAVEIIRRPHN